MGDIVVRLDCDEPSCRSPLLASADCEQPLSSRDGALAIVFDGRLDNRGDLHTRLDLHDVADARLALAAFERWGLDAPEHLIGDFAFAIWDERGRRLFCARDPLGIRPLYYWSDGRRFVCASDLAQILSTPGLPLEPNPGMIAEHLADAITSQDETVYAGIMRLPHGHSLIATMDGRVSRRKYWAIDPHRTLSCGGDAEYAARFGELFAEAVRCRLPGDGRAAVYLSGGIDSSALTAMACAVSPPHLKPETFSLAFGDDPERDELRYVEDVCRRCGVPSNVTRMHDRADPDCNAKPIDVLDALPDLPARDWKRGIRARGFRVALTGEGGDHGFYGSLYQYADLLRRGRIAATLRQWRTDRRRPGSGITLKDLVMSGLWPLLPPGVSRRLRPLARRVAGIEVVPAWIRPASAASSSLADRLRPARDAFTGGSLAGWDTRRNYESGWLYSGFEAAAREAARVGLDERHPFLDRRIVEFAAALPDDQRRRGELTRVVVRNALRGSLPESVQTRTSAGDGSWRVAGAAEAMAAAGLYESMALAEAGWIDDRVVAAMLGRMRERRATGDPRYAADAFPLWIVGGTERWFRASFKSSYTGGVRRLT